MKFKPGDRVRLIKHPSWREPWRGWAEKERMATVQSSFALMGGKVEKVKIKFDRQRAKTADPVFDVSDLELVEDSHEG